MRRGVARIEGDWSREGDETERRRTRSVGSTSVNVVASHTTRASAADTELGRPGMSAMAAR